MATQDNREYDLLVWGATGFTGRLVAQYMAGRAKTAGLRWAIGGRSAERLAEIKRDLVAAHGATEDEVGVVTGDSTKGADMEAVASRTHAVISTVGPFLKYGTPLVAACVKCGTHYADITGETAWVRRLIDDFHSEAQQKGVCIVPMSGFDSIPADLGTFMLADYVAKKYDARLGVVQAVMRGKGGVSGGTMASMLEMASQPSSGGARPSYPFFLNPRGQWSSLQVTRYDREQLLPRYDRIAKTWTSMFPMAVMNTRVVRRTNALLKDVYGPHFHYNEASQTSGLFMAILFTLMMALLGVMLMFRFTRENVLRRLLPAPGEGPSEEQRARSRFTYEIYGHVDYKDAAAAQGKPKMVKAVVAGRDPGYTETAVMLSEVGIALVELSAQRRLPVHAAVGGGGILTPASCLGSELVTRLQAAGLRLYTEDLN